VYTPLCSSCSLPPPELNRTTLFLSGVDDVHAMRCAGTSELSSLSCLSLVRNQDKISRLRLTDQVDLGFCCERLLPDFQY